MFGFSFPKIILLLIILFVVWNIFKLVEKKIATKSEDYKKKNTYKAEEEESLTECMNCGIFFNKELKDKCPLCKEANE